MLILKLSDSASVLNLGNHESHSVERVRLVERGLSVHVALAIGEGGLQIRGVELVWLGEAESSELPSLLDTGVHEAEGERDGSPLVIGLDLLEEVLVDHGVEGSAETGLHATWWLSSDLDSHLKQTEWEVLRGLRRDEEAEVWVDLLVLRVQDHLPH